MGKYAEGTAVPVERSRAEIEKTLTRYGASNFFFMNRDHEAVLGFSAKERMVRFHLPLPAAGAFTSGGRRRRTAAQAENARDAEVRRRWRALSFAIKAKLEIVESGIATFETEFLAQTVTHNGQTVAQRVLPAIETEYKAGKPAEFLLGPAPSKGGEHARG